LATLGLAAALAGAGFAVAAGFAAAGGVLTTGGRIGVGAGVGIGAVVPGTCGRGVQPGASRSNWARATMLGRPQRGQ
jgi:hypothetical protein